MNPSALPHDRSGPATWAEDTGGQALAFDWPVADAAETLLRQQLARFLEQNSSARRLAQSMLEDSGTDFFEWIDHFVLPDLRPELLEQAGFVCDESVERPRGWAVYEHPRATLPRVLLAPRGVSSVSIIALKPESIADFMVRHRLSSEPEGEPFSAYRRVVVAEENGSRLEAVERRAYRGFVTKALPGRELQAILKAGELCRTRQRQFAHASEGFRAINLLLTRLVELVGRDLACHLFFQAEREYWQGRNHAAQMQKQRQDRLGLGWGNHDHHTFRCSREHFVDAVSCLLRLGFSKRERYYAGAQAGWGAQICEQPVAGIVVFADVDLMPEETDLDFSVVRLPAAPKLGTVGLWVGLHGESLLEAGMHHLEARFDFSVLTRQLKEAGIKMMNPFSDFAFLRQAFTEGERWPVPRQRAEALLSAGFISPDQCRQFISHGALGSHLENLQRHGGFKGFNQKSVSAIISATDPRRHATAAPAAA